MLEHLGFDDFNDYLDSNHYHQSHVSHQEFGCEHHHPHQRDCGSSHILNLQDVLSIFFFVVDDVFHSVIGSSIGIHFDILEPTCCPGF